MPSANLITDSDGTGKAEWFREQIFLAIHPQKFRTKQRLISLASARRFSLRRFPLMRLRLTGVLTGGETLDQKNAFHTETIPTKDAARLRITTLEQVTSQTSLFLADNKASRS